LRNEVFNNGKLLQGENMAYKKLMCLVLLSSFCYVNSAYALDVGYYSELKKTNPVYLKAHIGGVGNGLLTYNLILLGKDEKLYCPPQTMALNADNYMEIIDDQIKYFASMQSPEGAAIENLSVEQLLLIGLIQEFPCTESKGEEESAKP
tara:strand:- start:203 stop:649 length:447 start_codon:yes stop_codon:yes gene_type:complete